MRYINLLTYLLTYLLLCMIATQFGLWSVITHYLFITHCNNATDDRCKYASEE